MPLFADTVRSLSASMIVAALAIVAIILGREILQPLALATMLAFILAPIVHRLVVTGLPRGIAAGLTVTAAFLVLATAGVLISTQLLSVPVDLAEHRSNIIRKVNTLAGLIRSDGVIARATESIESLERDLQKELKSRSTMPWPTPDPEVQSSPSGTESKSEGNVPKSIQMPQLEKFLSSLAMAGLTLLFTIFLLAQYHSLRDRIVRLAGTDNMTITAAALSDAGERLSSLFTMQAVLNVGFGSIVVVALTIIGVPNPILWGIAAGLLRFVPFIGSILAGVPPTLLAAAVDPGWGKAVATLIFFVIGEVALGHFVEPLVLGRRTGLSPLAFLISLSFWTLVWGPLGLVLAAPISICMVVLGQYIPRFEFMSVLLGDAPPLTPAQEFYHRLLSGDAGAAYEQLGADSTSSNAVSDEIVLPALRQAARDQRIGRIESSQIDEISRSLDDVMEMMEGDCQNEEVGEAELEDRPILLVAGRGPVDRMAAGYIASAIRCGTRRRPTLMQSATGLMALNTARQSLERHTPSDVILVSVGGLERSFAQLLARRAATAFPGARIITCDFSAPTDPTIKTSAEEAELGIVCTTYRFIQELVRGGASTRSSGSTAEAA